MDCSKLECGVGDRLSKLGDHVLGNILSYLPAKEAASAALLSTRWRHVWGAVHTVSLEEPEPPTSVDELNHMTTGCDSPCHVAPPDPDAAPPPFRSRVSAALLARQRRRGPVPLRSLRVAMRSYRAAADAAEVDQWVSYAVHQASPRGEPPDYPQDPTASFSQIGDPSATSFSEIEDPSARRKRLKAGDGGSQYSDDDDDSSVVSSDEDLPPWQRPVQKQNWPEPEPEYTVPRVIFSCAALRSLSLGFCRLAPPATVSLPSLVTLLLSHVTIPGADVERLIAGCPRLADLTLEACYEVNTLSVLGGGARLRRLALRCCCNLATVAVDASELRAFEYRGAVPNPSFLIMHGGRDVHYCKVDICVAKDMSSKEKLINLMHLLNLFVNARHLHLESSAWLGSGLDKEEHDVLSMGLPRFTSLRRLEMRGHVAGTTGAIDAMCRILEHAPNLEAISLAFYPQGHDCLSDDIYRQPSEDELLDGHHLSCSPHSVVAAAAASAMTVPCCLRSRVREINLVHYQGGTAQRALAQFLLCNAPVVDELWCEFAAGPMFEQVQLMREIKGWLINKSADTHFA
nr:unnamed protein product [Digitaria exilis]